MNSIVHLISTSVIISCNNGEKYLAEAIESVLAQTLPASEIIVVDDGSIDATKTIAASYPEVKYLYQHQQGASVARNAGLRASRGEYIIFLDYCDRLLPQALEIGVKYFNQYPDCGFVLGNCRHIDINGKTIDQKVRAIRERPYERPIYLNLLKGKKVQPLSRYLFHRSVFDVIGEFDPSLTVAEDYDMYLRIAAAFPGYCHAQAVVEYREHPVHVATVRPSQYLLASIKVLNKQKMAILGNHEYEIAYRKGMRHWCNVYVRFVGYDIWAYLIARKPKLSALLLYVLLWYSMQSLFQCTNEILNRVPKSMSTHSPSLLLSLPSEKSLSMLDIERQRKQI